ncbi:hypothetical protein PCANC_12251 [Puccinia coronata f. sp. avenae]|uniref:Uncharacterized protein n=1 Tax=Puccinia coronata f. sp. avenae TaxID=200324 RepID=A0A2N5UAD4_9BASI|nr:hypothetical protein PCANC_12251 [Puccinia coronata f. sp. avenae]
MHTCIWPTGNGGCLAGTCGGYPPIFLTRIQTPAPAPGTHTPRVQFALRRWVSRTVGSCECYENAPSPNPTFLEHIGSKRPAFSKRPGTTILFRPPIDWKTILVSN